MIEAEGDEDSNDHLPPIDQNRIKKKSRKLDDYVSDHSDSEFDSLNKKPSQNMPAKPKNKSTSLSKYLNIHTLIH